MNKHFTPGLIASLLFCNLLAHMLAPGLNADVTGSILGTATDSTSAVVHGVEVVATNLETNLSQTARTDSVGQYRFLALPVGSTKSRRRLPASRNSW